eukprot:SAG22_NODE_932_length_6448_cov_7.053709_2_plen_360_part_00
MCRLHSLPLQRHHLQWFTIFITCVFLLFCAKHDICCRQDYVFLYMPLLGENTQKGHGVPHCDETNTTICHAWFKQWQAKGDRTMGYFLEPVHYTINYALNVLGYRKVHVMGLSSGGWTTTLAAAVDPRIQVSFPIAGSGPLDILGATYTPKRDYEQAPQPDAPKGQWYLNECNYTGMYLLAGLEPGRTSLQILHQDDCCCFKGRGIHENITRYDDAIGTALATQGPAGTGVFSTAVTNWPVHMVCERDKAVIVATLRRAVSAAAAGKSPNLTGLPCDMLRGEATPCNEGPVPPLYIPPAPPPPPSNSLCQGAKTEAECAAGCCIWNVSCSPAHLQPPTKYPHKGGCYHGATPPVSADTG